MDFGRGRVVARRRRLSPDRRAGLLISSLAEMSARRLPWRWDSGLLGLCIIASVGLSRYVGIRGAPLPIDRAFSSVLGGNTDFIARGNPSWLWARVRDFSALGAGTTLTLSTVVVVLVLWLRGYRRDGLVAAAVIGGGSLANAGLKYLFSRTRPVAWDGSLPGPDSFPSGHTLMSTITFLTLVAVWRRFEPSVAIRRLALCLAGVLIVGVGLSRVYLGVHWITDVVAGWMFGVTWLLLCRHLIRRCERP